METVRIWDPGWKKVGSGIRDKHPGSATLLKIEKPNMFTPMELAVDVPNGHFVIAAF
jgi:hypothetical protein